MEDHLPPYVCCVLTEGIWTIFAATLLIIVLFTIATLKYFKKYLAKSKFSRRNLKLMSKLVNEDGKNAAAVIRTDDIAVDQFVKYCGVRRKKQGVNHLEFVRAIAAGSQMPLSTVALEKDNFALNQNSLSVPYDSNRVKLTSKPKSDYINASRIDGLERLGHHWIVTQGPLQNTIKDFWLMVWQEQASVIVMLTKTFECIKVMCVQYWPNSVKSTETFGDFVVTLLKEEVFAHYKVSASPRKGFARGKNPIIIREGVKRSLFRWAEEVERKG